MSMTDAHKAALQAGRARGRQKRNAAAVDRVDAYYRFLKLEAHLTVELTRLLEEGGQQDAASRLLDQRRSLWHDVEIPTDYDFTIWRNEK